MKLLADMGISMATVHALREAGEDIVHLREQALHRMADDRILAKAVQERRIVVTCDLDFGDLMAAAGGGAPSHPGCSRCCALAARRSKLAP